MSVQSLIPAAVQYRDSRASSKENPRLTHRQPGENWGRAGGSKLHMTAQTYRASSLVMEFNNADGDRVSLRYESIEYQKVAMSASSSSNGIEWENVLEGVRDQFMSLQQRLIESFIRSTGGEVAEETKTVEVKAAQVPDYWNAENTSQRIVDFATAFYASFEGQGEEFLDRIRSAIEEGFSQARHMMGSVPGPVAKLTSDTYELVMAKLDAWATSRGIGSGVEQTSVAA